MKKQGKILQGIVVGIFMLSCIVFFHLFDSGFLFGKESMVDLPSLPDAVSLCLNKPALLSRSLSKVLVSCLVPVGAGALMLTGVLLLEWWILTLVLKRFYVGEMAFLYALLPVLLEWGTYCSPKYYLSSILSLIITLSLFYFYTSIKSKWMSMIAGSILLLGLYSLVGRRLFLFVVLVLLYEAETGEKQRWGYWTLLLLISLLLPELQRNIYLLSDALTYQQPDPWLPAFFPAISVGCVIVATLFKKIRHLSVTVKSVSITSGLLVLFWVVTVFGHAAA